MARNWDAISYVSRSKYREHIADHLHGEGPATPSEIAEATGHALPHVSRALSQLRDRGLVELLVSEEEHHGRLYGLTEDGRAAVTNMRRDQLEARLTISRPDRFSKPRLLQFLQNELGDSLRWVERYTDNTAEITFVHSNPRDDPADEGVLLCELALAWRSDIPDSAVNAFGNNRYMVGGFESVIALYLFPDDASHYAISTDTSMEVSIGSLVNQCFARL